eukprot:3601302-Amphidinium_carterae.1
MSSDKAMPGGDDGEPGDRPDPGACSDGGPRWEKVWKRATYNLDNGEKIAEELVSDMTKKDLNRALPENIRNIRTVLYYRTTEKSDIEDKVEKSRKDLFDFDIPAEPPPEKKVKLKAKSTPITSQQVMASSGEKRQKWIESIQKELVSFKNNHATFVFELMMVCMEWRDCVIRLVSLTQPVNSQ